MKRKDMTEIIWTATDGVFCTLTNTLLFLFFIHGASFGKTGSVGAHRMFSEAESALSQINYQTIKKALHRLREQRYIKTRSRKKTVLEISITKYGKKRIESLFPRYLTTRPWDGHIYLISYDIPTRANKSRDLLREYIKRTGGALLQKSLWINPYDPRLLLEIYMREHHIPGTILVSKLGTDGAIGEEKLEALLRRVYHLDQIAERYEKFLQKYESQSAPASCISLMFDYVVILKDDPQLPFALIPQDFPAERAHRLFQQSKLP